MESNSLGDYSSSSTIYEPRPPSDTFSRLPSSSRTLPMLSTPPTGSEQSPPASEGSFLSCFRHTVERANGFKVEVTDRYIIGHWLSNGQKEEHYQWMLSLSRLDRPRRQSVFSNKLGSGCNGEEYPFWGGAERVQVVNVVDCLRAYVYGMLGPTDWESGSRQVIGRSPEFDEETTPQARLEPNELEEVDSENSWAEWKSSVIDEGAASPASYMVTVDWPDTIQESTGDYQFATISVLRSHEANTLE
ncbi:hypothetical protein BCR39DRAFT_557752 [Naematelia encephala]|uniref:Uncharacterized protein n=1 Tax=Naematelia encephala TaxID=71784 RepID=A0A1Y2BDF6_9TREE|nr:hypothetical protein BCR39DRAFT_557752 [Naematelia encephala]